MRLFLRPRVLAGLALLAMYLVRAVTGAIGGTAFVIGKTSAANGDYPAALGSLDHAGVGFDRFDTLLLRAEMRLSQYDRATVNTATGKDTAVILDLAARDFMEAAAACPASGLPWAGLAQAYTRLERAAFEVRPVGAGSGEGGWVDVGRAGRVAVGMFRLATRRNPEVHMFLDQLVQLFLELGIKDETSDTVRLGAKVQPFFFSHGWDLRTFPTDLIEAFDAESRRALGRTPMLNRGQHLLSLGRVAHRLGHLEQAERDLRAAVALRAPLIQHAEFAYYLALVMIDAGQYREAEKFLDEAARYPSFLVNTKDLRATIAEKEGRLDSALAWLQQARQLEPRNLWFCIRFARVARQLGDWKGAIEALRWAIVQHPGETLPRIELVETHLAAGDSVAADWALRELERMVGPTADVLRLHQAIDPGASRTGT